MATHSDVLAGGIPWTEEAGRLLSQSQRRMKRLSTAQLVDRAVFRHRDSWWRNTLWHSIKSLNL